MAQSHNYFSFRDHDNFLRELEDRDLEQQQRVQTVQRRLEEEKDAVCQLFPQ